MNHVKKRTRWIIGIAAILVILAALGLTRIYASDKSFEVTLDNSAAGGNVETRLYSADNQSEIGTVLREKGYPVDSDSYKVDTALTTKVADVDAVTITHVAEATEPVVSPTKTDESQPAAEQPVQTADTAASEAAVQAAPVTATEEKKEIRYEEIPYSTERVENAELAAGTETVTTEGVTGSKKVTEKVVYENGVKVSREVLAEKVIAEPVNAVVEVGTKPAQTVKEETREVSVPYQTETRENAELEKGTTNVLVKGENGTAQVTEQVTYDADGKEISREEISRTTIKEAVNEVVEVGTREVTTEETPQVPAEEETPTTDSAPAEEPVQTPEPAPEPEPEPEYATEQVSASDLDTICAIVAQEDNTSYEGALAVISCVMNRVDEGNWGGSTALGVLKAPGQFSAYLDGSYKKYLNGNYPDYVREAVEDCMLSGIRNHDHTSFRGYQTSGSEKIGGNWYF